MDQTQLTEDLSEFLILPNKHFGILDFSTLNGTLELSVPKQYRFGHTNTLYSIDEILEKMHRIYEYQAFISCNYSDYDLSEFYKRQYYKNVGHIPMFDNTEYYSPIYQWSLALTPNDMLNGATNPIGLATLLMLVRRTVPYMTETALFVNSILELYVIMRGNMSTITEDVNTTIGRTPESIIKEYQIKAKNSRDDVLTQRNIGEFYAMSPVGTDYSKEMGRLYRETYTMDTL